MFLKDLFFILVYVIFGVLTRTVWHIAPNVEFVTGLSIAGAFFICKKYSLAIPLGIMIISDLIIGNSSIYIFTWSSYVFAWVIGLLLRSNRVSNLFKKLSSIVKVFTLSEAGGILFTLFFFLWTNFGVVVVTEDMYSKNIMGLIESYTMGLPFLIPQLIGNIIIVPIVFVFTKFAYETKLNNLQSLILKVSQRIRLE